MEIKLHPGQLEVFRDSHKIRVLVCGRRYGKTRLQINELIVAALTFKGRVDPVSPERVIACMPTLAMAKQTIWEPLVSLCRDLPQTAKINAQDLRIDFKGGKPSILVTSAEGGGDRIRGKRIYFGALDEIQDFPKDVLDAVVLPATADTPGSRLLCTGTPKGRGNHLYSLFNREFQDPDTYRSFTMPTASNPFVPREEIERARKVLPGRLFRQEYESSFELYEGQVYSELSEENLVDSLPERFDMVVLGVDWGQLHPCVTAWGRSEGKWYWLEGWEGDTGSAVPEAVFRSHIERLAYKWDVKAVYCDPAQPGSILSLRFSDHRALQSAISGYNRISDGITQVHSLIYQRRLLFPRQPLETEETGTINGLKAYEYFQAYHYEKDATGNVLETPADGPESHPNDASRYCLATFNGVLSL